MCAQFHANWDVQSKLNSRHSDHSVASQPNFHTFADNQSGLYPPEGGIDLQGGDEAAHSLEQLLHMHID